jgi:hypothetical protein
MKPTALLLSFCSLALLANAQPGMPSGLPINPPAKTPEGNLSTLRAITIQLNEDPAPASPQHAFAHFEVLDERPDTARIGVHGNLPMRSHAFDRQLVFSKPAAQEITTWLNRHFTHTGARDSVMIILRYLWLSDTDPYSPIPDGYSILHPNDPAVARTHIRLKAEIYVHRNNEFLPLLRIDTLEPTKHVSYNSLKSTYKGWEKDIAHLLHDLADDAALAAGHRKSSGRWISWEDICRFNQSRFDIPIFDSNTLVRGVYTGFEEFRNNAPSIHDFEVRPTGGHLALYLRNGDGTSYYTHDVWGVCDGKEVFIMRDGLLHPLRKDGNSFYFYGVDIAADSYPPPPLNAFSGYPEQHCLYVIDMDTGQFY